MRRALAVLVLSATTLTAAAQSGPPQTGEASFVVRVHGRMAGTIDVLLGRTDSGWTIRTTSQLGAPLDVTIKRFDIDYTSDWKPRHVTLDMATREQGVVVHGGFGAAPAARLEIIRDGRQVVFVTAPVSDDVLVLPSLAFGAYEALAGRLQSAAAGTTLNVYVFPQREMMLRLESVKDEAIRAGSRRVRTRRWRVVFADPAGDVPADVWVDQGRLARLDLPASGLSILRKDLTAR